MASVQIPKELLSQDAGDVLRLIEEDIGDCVMESMRRRMERRLFGEPLKEGEPEPKGLAGGSVK